MPRFMRARTRLVPFQHSANVDNCFMRVAIYSLWDSGVRKALKQAAAEDGCYFAGLGPPTLRRANIT